MARRTKEDALATRDSILDAAEGLFIEQGVSRTTLQHVASKAGVTRGAIYWHFEDKGAMFNALMERAKMPLESAMQALDQTGTGDPLGDLHAYATSVFRLTMDDPQARRAFEIATLKMEYVEELSAVRERRRQNMAEWQARAESRVRIGVMQGQIKASVNPGAVGLGLWVLVEGLIRNWLIDPQFDLVLLGGEIVDTHLDSLRA